MFLFVCKSASFKPDLQDFVECCILQTAVNSDASRSSRCVARHPAELTRDTLQWHVSGCYLMLGVGHLLPASVSRQKHAAGCSHWPYSFNPRHRVSEVLKLRAKVGYCSIDARVQSKPGSFRRHGDFQHRTGSPAAGYRDVPALRVKSGGLPKRGSASTQSILLPKTSLRKLWKTETS